VDLHLRHRCAFFALDAPHFMQIFLINNRLSASGNRVIGYRLWCIENKHIIFKYDALL
jgi:hypothetical protein